MTTPTPHPFAHVLTALARDKDTKFQIRLENGSWKDIDTETLVHSILYRNIEPQRFRAKPATIRIGEREVPKPNLLDGRYALDIGAYGGERKRYYWDFKADCDAAAEAIQELLEGRP